MKLKEVSTLVDGYTVTEDLKKSDPEFYKIYLKSRLDLNLLIKMLY